MSLPHLLRGKKVWIVFLTFSLLPAILQDYRNSLSLLTWSSPTITRASVDGARAQSHRQLVWKSGGGHELGFSRRRATEAGEPRDLMLLANRRWLSLKACPRTELNGVRVVASASGGAPQLRGRGMWHSRILTLFSAIFSPLSLWKTLQAPTRPQLPLCPLPLG